ncbi:MAG: hypothetical protein ACRD1B_02870, partial [Thermoanaerobaculia bacterium]
VLSPFTPSVRLGRGFRPADIGTFAGLRCSDGGLERRHPRALAAWQEVLLASRTPAGARRVPV